jgi:hypothetical protein
MNSTKNVKGEVAVETGGETVGGEYRRPEVHDVENVKGEVAVETGGETVGGEYRRPEVHYLGQLEQVQGCLCGIFADDRGLTKF